VNSPIDVEAQIRSRMVSTTMTSAPLPDCFPVALHYSSNCPYEVRADFGVVGDSVGWAFARDLLRAGLSTPTGDGDVHVCPSRGTGRRKFSVIPWRYRTSRELLMISLTSRDGQAVLEATADDVRSFLDRTAAVVAYGDESAHMPIDSGLDTLLGR